MFQNNGDLVVYPFNILQLCFNIFANTTAGKYSMAGFCEQGSYAYSEFFTKAPHEDNIFRVSVLGCWSITAEHKTFLPLSKKLAMVGLNQGE